MNPAWPSAPAAGVAFSLSASTLFALMAYYTTLLAPLGGLQIYGWRIALTVPLLTLFLLASGRGPALRALLARVPREPALWLLLPLSSLLLGIQLWLFMWAPLHGHALDVSLGYFLLPLTLVLTGRWLFGESLSRWQKAASLLATVGVLLSLLGASGIAWPVLVVALGYPLYYVLRRRLRTDNLAGLWLDMTLSLPVALFCILPMDTGAVPPTAGVWLLVLGLGIISAAALLLMVASSQALPLALFGLLGYVEPLLLVIVALLIGERIEAGQWPTYIALWGAVTLLGAEAVVSWRHWRRRARPLR